MPCLVILQNSSWQQPARMWQQPSTIFWCGNSVFCDLSIWTPKTTGLCINPCVLLSFEKAMLSCWPDSEAMPQATRWQSMPADETVWHIFAVFHVVFKESDCCQLGLGDWLASQSPNQVDSTHGANKNCQPTTQVHYFDNFLGHGPPEYANPGPYVWFCAPDVKHHAKLDNSWSHIMPD